MTLQERLSPNPLSKPVPLSYSHNKFYFFYSTYHLLLYVCVFLSPQSECKLHEFGFCWWPIFAALRSVPGKEQALRQSRCCQGPALVSLKPNSSCQYLRLQVRGCFPETVEGHFAHVGIRLEDLQPQPLPKRSPQLVILSICCTNTTVSFSFSRGGFRVRIWGEDFWDQGSFLTNTLLAPFPSQYCFPTPQPSWTSKVNIYPQILVSGSVWSNLKQDDKYSLLLNELFTVDSGYTFKNKTGEGQLQHSFTEGGKLA